MGYWDDKQKEVTDLKARVNELRQDNDVLRDRHTRAQLLVAGAMRQSFVNDRQREALLYAFMALTGETNEKLAMLMIWIAPRNNAPLALPKPRDKDVPPYQSPDYNNNPWGWQI